MLYGFLVVGAKAEDEEMDPTTTDWTWLLILVTMAMGAVAWNLVVYMVERAFRPSPGPAPGRVQLLDTQEIGQADAVSDDQLARRLLGLPVVSWVCEVARERSALRELVA